MNTTLLRKIGFVSVISMTFAVITSMAQTVENAPAKRVNFGYSQNPKTKTKRDAESAATEPQKNDPAPTVENAETIASTNETIAKKTLEVVKNASRQALAPTESYQVGAGDILFINLQNSSKGANLFTVLNDGTIDYPLAGEMVSVAGLTTDEIEEILREKIKLYENAQVSVKIREYASHKITVLGLVEKTGEKYIQRDAVPLFVVRAESGVDSKADRVVIRRNEADAETFDLKDEKVDNTLVYPGDIIEFSSSETPAKSGKLGFFFIGGEIVSGGQKDFYEGMTLTQAILASGGLKKESVKKIVVRRKNEAGLLVSTEFNLKQIKDGKVPDPVLKSGDTIEVGG